MQWKISLEVLMRLFEATEYNYSEVSASDLKRAPYVLSNIKK